MIFVLAALLVWDAVRFSKVLSSRIDPKRFRDFPVEANEDTRT